MVNWLKESRNSKHRPTLSDFKKASRSLEGVILRTPLIPLRRYREEDSGILLKPEMLQPIGSYKIRGVYNWVARLTPKQRARGIATLSTGNMAQAVGYVANLFGIPSRIAISENAAKTKVENCRKYGSEVDLAKFDDTTFEKADSLGHGYCFINPLADFGLMDGYGSISLEIVKEMPDVKTIFVPLGAGFLSSGVAFAAKALNPSIKVIGVNAENSPHYYESWRSGKPVPAGYKSTMADGIAAWEGFTPSEVSLRLIREALDDVLLVSESEMAKTVRMLALENKLVTEAAGAAGLAAALKTPKEERGRTVCILSGGSIDAVKLAHILEEE